MDMSNNYFFIIRFLSPFRIFCFVLHFDYFIIKKSCLSVCGETITYSSPLCDISLERLFNYLVIWYIISQVQIC